MNRQRRHGWLCAVVISAWVVSACSDKDDDSVIGTWYRGGYEEYYVVTDTTASLFKTTPNVSTGAKQWCETAASFPFVEFWSAVVSNGADTLELDSGALLDADDAPYRYIRVDTLPEACTQETESGTLLTDFEQLWHAFAAFYPYFTLHEIDWQREYQNILDDLSESTTSVELLQRVAEVLEPTEDVHLALELPNDESFAPPLRFHGILSALAVGFEQQESFDDFFDYALFQINDEFPALIERLHVDVQGHFVGTAEDEEVPVIYRWGRLGKSGNDRIGYLSVSSFVTADFSTREEEQALQRAFDELDDTDSLIIDVRDNLGGSFNMALALAGFLVSDTTPAFTVEPYLAGEQYAPRVVNLHPSSMRVYDKPVVVLHNGLSTSAAETFLLATTALPYVTRLGERTQGATASSITRQLPLTDMTLHIPSEVHRSLEGTVFEKSGVIADIVVVDDRLEGIDSMMAMAIEHLEMTPQ